MRRMACIVFEVEDGENIREALEKALNGISGMNSAYIEEGCLDNMPIISLAKVTTRNNIKESEWGKKFIDIMSKLKIDASYKGYRSLYYIMEEIAKNPEYDINIYIKPLYAYVSIKTGYTSTQIDRQLRTIVDKIYDFNSSSKINEVLNIYIDSRNQISNGGLIAALAKEIFK